MNINEILSNIEKQISNSKIETSIVNIENPYNFNIPSYELFNLLLKLILEELNIKKAELNIFFATIEEIQNYNNSFLKKDKPTNILSFPFENDSFNKEILELNYFFGDIIISHHILEEEAKNQNKKLLEHYCHIFIHGVLHLIGFDHIKKEDAIEMERLEIKLLQKLNISNPYEYI